MERKLNLHKCLKDSGVRTIANYEAKQMNHPSLYDAIGYFTEEKKIMACLSVTCGRADTERHAMRGVADLQGTPVTEDAIYDLASLTKLFTGLTAMRLREEGRLDFTKPVTAYAPQFTGLAGVTVDQVLGFEVALVTPERVDHQPDRDAGLRQLFAIAPAQVTGRAYSDMHSMVLKYVIEGAADQPLYEAIRQRILGPLGMEHTYARVPAERVGDCVSYDREHRIEGSRRVLRAGIEKGTPHDPKAHLLQQDGDLCGHAGLFSTRSDMTRLCQGVLRGEVIGRESLRFMARNRTGRRLPEGGWTQFLGCQCYVKHPEQHFSEIPVYMSDQAIGLSGFTGNHLSVDVETGVFALFLGNRVLNRLTVLVPEKGRTYADYGLAEDGSGQTVWTDGSRCFSSVNYVHQKDARLHAPIAGILRLSPWRRAGSEWP